MDRVGADQLRIGDGTMALPLALASAFAPAIIDHLTGKGKAAEKIPEPVMEVLAAAAEDGATQERRKASVRPRTMQQVWISTIVTKLAFIAIAAAPGFTEMSVEASAHALNYLLYLLDGQGAYLGYAHGTRTVEKMKGKA